MGLLFGFEFCIFFTGLHGHSACIGHQEGKGYCRCLASLNCEGIGHGQILFSCCDDSHVLGSLNKSNENFEDLPLNKLGKIAMETSTQF